MISTSNDVDSVPPFVIKAAAAASLGGLVFGYDMGVISMALPGVSQEFELDEKQQEMIVSFLYIGCVIGSVLGGYLCDKYGRKRMIMVTDLGFIMGAKILFAATEYQTILCGRIIMGCAVAISGVADVAYLHEISPSSYRGSIVSCNEACISAGFMLSYLSGYVISICVQQDGWRYMFLAGGLIALVQFMCMCCMPESPVWLQENGRINEANSALIIIHGDGWKNFYIEMTPSQHDESKKYGWDNHDQENTAIGDIPEKRPNDTYLVIFRDYYRQVIITIFLSAMQNLCGHPNVLNFAPRIFAQIGFDSEEGRLISTSLVGVFKFTTVCYTLKKVDDYGRKHFILVGMCMIAVSLFILALTTAINEEGNVNMFWKIISTIGVFGVASGYSLSFGPLVWLIVSEIFPSSIRGRGLGLSSICSYASAALVSYTFLSVQKAYGPSIPFAIYFLLTLFSVIFADIAIPETNRKEPEDIHTELEETWLLTSNKKGRRKI